MRILLLMLFTVLPLIEIALLIKIGQSVGLWPTLALLVATATAGAMVLHQQGMNTLLRIQQAMMKGEAPVGPMLDGVMLALAGTLLITPGVITDITGLLLLVPQIRTFIKRRLVASMMSGADVRVDIFTTGPGPEPPGRPPNAPGSESGPVIEGEFERLDERSPDPRRKTDK